MEPDKYNLVIAGGALQKLKELAAYLNIPESELHQVVGKGIKLLDVAKNGKIYVESTDGHKYSVNLKDL